MSYRWIQHVLSTLILVVFSFESFAQTEITVLDENGETLPAAHISYNFEKGKKSQTILTDLSGNVIIPSSESQGKNFVYIKIGYVGYLSRHDSIEVGSKFTFQLQIDEITLNQIVITGQYSPNSPEKSIHKIKIIDREQMDARGVVNLNDALQFETNMRISQDNMLGSSVSVQGMSGENVKIMIDGVPIIGRQDGNIDLNQINLNNIERIEIVEGPLSVNYGTNALAGTINLITKKDRKNTYNTSINSYYESVGQYNVDGNIGYKKGKHLLSISGGRNYFDGWSPEENFSLFPQSRPADTNRNLQWNPKEQLYLNGQYTYSHKKTTYRLFGDLFNESIISRGSPRNPYNLTAFDEYFNTNRFMTGIDMNGKVGERSNWTVLASYSDYNRYRYKYIKDLTTLEEQLTKNPEDHDTTNIKTWMSRGAIRFLSKESKFDWELGYDLNTETATGKRIADNEQTIGDYAVFTTAEWRPTYSLAIKPGLRYSYNTAYNAPLIPSVNVKYIKGKLSYRFSFARGFRAPSLKELYFEFVDVNHNIYGNSNLLAEASYNLQFDASYKLVKSQRLTTVEAGLFFNEINDMISLAQVSSAQDYTYINIGNYRTQGIDLSVSHVYNHWRFTTGFVYTGRSDIEADMNGESNMFYSPEFRAVSSYEFKKIGGNLSLYYKYNGKLPVYSVNVTGDVSQDFSESYQMVDLTATKYFFNKRLNWTFGVKNLLDVQNIASSSTSGGVHNNASGIVPVSWGRTVFSSLKFNFGWK